MPTRQWLESPQDVSTPSDGLKTTRWSIAGPRILESTIEWSNCDCVIIRKEAPDAQNLTLEGYQFAGQYSDHELAVPERKSLRFWNGDAFHCCLTQHYVDGSLEALRGRERESFSPQEEEFLNRVCWRGSFPISIDSGDNRLVILVSLGADEPLWLNREQLALSWLAAQLIAVNDGLAGSLCAEAARHLPAIAYSDSKSNQLGALLRILCSGRGLGWQRVWLMKRSGSTLTCENCAGGLTLDEWGHGAAFAADNLSDLTDEIAHDIVDQPREQDGLYRVCVSDQQWVVDDEELFPLDDGPNESRNVLFRLPSELGYDAANRWRNHLAATTGIPEAFGDDERIYWCPLQFADDEYSVVMTWNREKSDSPSPREIETGSVLAAASEIMASPRIAPDIDDDAEGDESPSFLEKVVGLLSWLNVSPLSRTELERAKARRATSRFNSSPEYRKKLQARMLAARKRRHDNS